MKPFWKSKTFWTAIFTFVATLVFEMTGNEIPQSVMNTVWMVLMMVLRVVTKEPISLEP